MGVEPPAANVEQQAAAAKKGVFTCLDVEQWKLDQRAIPSSEVDANLNLYIGLIREFKADAAGVRVGYYELPPIRQVKPLAPSSPAFLAWQQANDRLTPLVNAVDFAFPSLYTFTTDSTEWTTYAKANVAEARRVAPKLPLYAFLWPRYHENTPNALQPIDAVYWKLQLETLKSIADGVVIWESSKFQWDPSAAWWQATRAFLQESGSKK
jgi:hypothetical protein